MTRDFALLDEEKVFEKLSTSKEGLSTNEVKIRQEHYGLNILTNLNKIPLWKKLLEPFLDVFVYILIIAAIISAVAKEPLDAAIITVILFANAIIYYVQRFSSDRVLDKLKSYDKRTISVIRDGQPKTVNANELVPGDIVVLEEGAQVPADGRLIIADQFKTNESSLTGESAHVDKNNKRLHKSKPIYLQSNMVFQGTLVVSGQAQFVVTATGNKTELGRIAHLIPSVQNQTEIEKSINKLFSRVVMAVGLVAVLVFGLGLLRGIAFGDSLRYAISLTVSAIPEGLPLAISVILIFGARKMAKNNALVRRLRAIEAFGQTSVILTDKTGTLTKNQLELSEIWGISERTEIKRFVSKSVSVDHTHLSADSMEVALQTYGVHAEKGWQHKGLIPFDQENRLSGSYWRTNMGLIAVVKGAPEGLLRHSNLNTDQRQKLEAKLTNYLSSGKRVLAIGTQKIESETLPKKFIPKKITLLGLLVFEDAIRPEAKAAVLTARQAGIQVVMLTGDHVSTAQHVGNETGIITGNQVAAHADEAVIDSIKQDPLGTLANIRVLARVLPEYKYEILCALQHHHVVIMTGDGINDVPALSKSDIGIAMGSGTDAAKEASDVVLLDNNFASIVKAIEQGRAVTANIKRMVYFLFATNISTIIVILFSLLAGLPIPLLAVQVLWLNLVVDGAAVIPLGLENPESDLMKQKPHRLSRGLFNSYDRLRIIVIASTMATITLLIYTWYSQYSSEIANTVAFTSLVFMQWANAINARSFHKPIWQSLKQANYRLYAAIAGVASLQIVLLTTPLGKILRLEPIGSLEAIIIFVSPLVVILVDSFYKLLFKDKYIKT